MNTDWEVISSAPFPSRLLGQLLMNEDLKTAEAPLPTKNASAVGSISPCNDSPPPLEGIPVCSLHL